MKHEITKDFLDQLHQCKTQDELDLFHQKNCLIISNNPELIKILYKKRYEIIDEIYTIN